MPRGGWRGGGRPTKEKAAENARLFLESIGADEEEINVRAILAKIIRHPATSKTDRFRALEQYAKLPPPPPPPATTAPVQVLTLPPGVQFAEDGKTLIWPETGEPVDLSEMAPVVPFEPTPSWPAETSSKRLKPEPVLERLEVVGEVPSDGKVTTLRPYGRVLANGRRLAGGPEDILDDDGEPGPGAA